VQLDKETRVKIKKCQEISHFLTSKYALNLGEGDAFAAHLNIG